jgi:hypothetical protein
MRARRRRPRRSPPTSRAGAAGAAEVRARQGVKGGSSLSQSIGAWRSRQAKQRARGLVICQPSLSRRNNDRPKMLRSGTRATMRLVRAVQSVPLDIRITTARLSSSSDARPVG